MGFNDYNLPQKTPNEQVLQYFDGIVANLKYGF